MNNPLSIDGSFGEGGGQILRSSLALSILTQTPFTLTNIRAGRKSPGLKKQHLKCIEAAVALSDGKAEGATFKSSKLSFTPGTPKAGDYRIEIGSAGSTMLVLQTILPIMLTMDEQCALTVTGGTHNPWAPPFEFFRDSFIGQLKKMGAHIEVQLTRYGFFPQGGGEVTLTVTPAELSPITINERGKLRSTKAKVINLRKPTSIATEQLEAVEEVLTLNSKSIENRAPVGPGNSVVISQEYEHITAVQTGFLKRKRMHGIMAKVTAEKMQNYAENSFAVDQHLTDQLLIPMLLADGGSFTCDEPTLHSTTNAEVIRLFSGLEPSFQKEGTHWSCTVPSGFTKVL